MVYFFHWLMNSNRLAVLSQLSKSVYRVPATILPSLLTRMQFNGDSQYKTHDYLLWWATKYPSNGSLLTWSCKLDKGWQYTINNLHHPPLQLNLGELSTMSTIYDWPQLRRAPIKFGRFIKLCNINVKVLYKQADIGFAAEAVFFWGGKGAFCPKKGCNAPSAGYRFPKKKKIRKLNMYCKLL